ncbi:MAG: TIGR03118 family protein [Gaiellaceae bacterium]
MHGAIRRSTVVLGVLFVALVAVLHAAAGPPANAYTVTPLVSDIPGVAPVTDPDLVNAWGLARSATSPWWVADNGPDPSSSKSTVYTNDGTKLLSVDVLGAPTGAVFAGIADNFPIATDTDPTLGPASFIFATENGDLRAWRGGSTALVAPTTGIAPGAIFKGLAIAEPTPGSPLLYATDFHNGQVEVFDGAWQNVTPPGAFVDPNLPEGAAPFGIQAIGSDIFVTYAKQDADAEDDVHGQGLGIVDEYDLQGNLVTRVAQHGLLNAPWGLAMAPDSFGRFGGDLLVGNFGNGEINAYHHGALGWQHAGTLRTSDGNPLMIDGLWALQFGNTGLNGDPNTLFFTAGPNDESDGLFGTITTG